MRIERLKLRKLNNTRDLGGFPTKDGKKIKRGKLIRSGRLYNLPKSTVAALKAMGVSTIIDMRIQREQIENPNTEIDGVKVINLPIVCAATAGITHAKSMARTMLEESRRIKTEFGTADNYMNHVYELILFGEDGKKKLREFFDILIESEGCVLWHCNAGKDRTGLCSMLLEELLGVERDLVVQDYCISRKFQYRKRFWQLAGLQIAPIPRDFKHILIALIEPKPGYIIEAIAKIEERYGSVEGYCKQALGLTDEHISILKNKFTE